MPIVFPESLKDLTLWRYMGLEKLLSLLQSRSLYFAQLKSFRDPYEGMVPIAWQGAITDVSQIPDFSASNGSPEWQQIMLSIPDGQHLKDEKLRTELYVSCWHSNPHESAAMWSLYSKTSGLAIRTTSNRLADALRDCQPRVELAAVQYSDIVPGLLSGNPWSIKRPSFQHEVEIRAVIRDPHGSEEGLLVPVDLEVLIEEVYISPEAESWVASVVKDVIAKYGLGRSVHRSGLWTLS
jgi:hypothetical protein